VQSAFGCVYEGQISECAVLDAAEKMAVAGITEINLADSRGLANPGSVQSLVGLIYRNLPNVALSLHFHDTRGMGLANMYSGYQAGLEISMFAPADWDVVLLSRALLVMHLVRTM
jgi:hydroxymethylglutaryl-CoA lyase